MNAKAADGNSPLHLAAREGDVELAEFLLSAGADPCLLNSQSQTPHEVACVWAEEELELLNMLHKAIQKKTALQRLQTKEAIERARVEAQQGDAATAESEASSKCTSTSSSSGLAMAPGTTALESVTMALLACSMEAELNQGPSALELQLSSEAAP